MPAASVISLLSETSDAKLLIIPQRPGARAAGGSAVLSAGAVVAFLSRIAVPRTRNPTAWSARCDQKQKCGNRHHAPPDPILFLPHPASSHDRSGGSPGGSVGEH